MMSISVYLEKNRHSKRGWKTSHVFVGQVSSRRQSLYVQQYQNACMIDLSNSWTVGDDINIYEKCHFLKEDSPVRQQEVGQ